MYITNKYSKWYDQIINNAKIRTLPSEVYVEKHHIIPECFFLNRARKGPPGLILGNPNDQNNIVKLTAREHFICHWLLIKMTEGKLKSKMWLALHTMIFAISPNTKRNFIINSQLYATVKEECAKISSINSKKFHTGRKRSDETKLKISESLKGKTHSDKHKKNNQLAQINRNYKHSPEIIEIIRKSSTGYIATTETRLKISLATKGKKKKPWSGDRRNNQPNQKGLAKPSMLCPFCKKLGGGNTMKRWHFDNCKIKDAAVTI